MRAVMATHKLPEMRHQLKKLERQVADLVALADELRARLAIADPNSPRVAGAETQSRRSRDAA
jgi:hypothetical protein